MKDPDLGTSAELWDHQYRSGRWAYLSTLEQLPRYALLAAWIERLHPAASVLDVGCGEGILIEWLRSCRRYEGIDISQTALVSAKNRPPRTEHQVFHCASAEAFYSSCSTAFDCIVFNEVLYCCADPIQLLARYERLLTPAGHLLVSVTDYEPKVWKDIQALYGNRFVCCVRIEDRQVMKAWSLAAIAAKR